VGCLAARPAAPASTSQPATPQNKQPAPPMRTGTQSGYRLLSLYVRLWGVQQALLLHGFQDDVTARWVAASQATLVALAFCFPERPVPVCCAVAARVIATAAKVPFLHESKYWWLQTDLVFLTLLLRLCSSGSGDGRAVWRVVAAATAAPMPAAVAAQLVALASATIRAQLALFYLAAGIWKINSSFLHVHYSCAPVFLLQLADAYLPQHWLQQCPWLVLGIGHAAPTLTIGVEVAVGALLMCGVTRGGACNSTGALGVALGGLLHLTIAMTPPPNNIGTFSFGCCARLFLLVPNGTCHMMAEVSQLLAYCPGSGGGGGPFSVGAAAAGLAAAVLASTVTVTRHSAGHATDIPLLVTSMATVFLLRAAMLEWRLLPASLQNNDCKTTGADAAAAADDEGLRSRVSRRRARMRSPSPAPAVDASRDPPTQARGSQTGQSAAASRPWIVVAWLYHTRHQSL
jgi:hypothetical protein